LPLLDLQLKFLDQNSDRNCDAIITAADEIISAIDLISLSSHYGMKMTDSEDPVLIRTRKEMDKMKGFLINAMYLKGNALLEKQGKKGVNEAIHNAINAFKAWGDIEDSKYSMLEISYQRNQGYLGFSLKSAMKSLENSPTKQMGDLQMELVENLGWDYLVNYLRNWNFIKFPAGFAIS